MSRIAVIAAHPDDEALGCGASMAAHAATGDEVCVVILAQGLTSRGLVGERELEAHRQAARRANACLGVTNVRFLEMPDNRMDELARLDVIQGLEAIADELAPDRVYTHFPGDLNVDHRRTAEAVATVWRPQPGRARPEILFFEVASSTGWSLNPGFAGFTPNVYRDVSPFLDRKRAALEAYAHEMRAWPHARSIAAVEHLARWRGAEAGLEAAEAFMLGRRIER